MASKKSYTRSSLKNINISLQKLSYSNRSIEKKELKEIYGLVNKYTGRNKNNFSLKENKEDFKNLKRPYIL